MESQGNRSLNYCCFNFLNAHRAARSTTESCNQAATMWTKSHLTTQSRIQWIAIAAAAVAPLRLSVINTNYSKDEARKNCLETLAWSLNCLSASADKLGDLEFEQFAHQTYAVIWWCQGFFNAVWITWLDLGAGTFPDRDPWGNIFHEKYYPARAVLAGRPLSGEGFIGILEGIQADQDWLRSTFELSRTANRQLCCYYCDCVQWISTKHHHMYNDRNNLYTIFGPCEASTTILIWNMLALCRINACLHTNRFFLLSKQWLHESWSQGSWQRLSSLACMAAHLSALCVGSTQNEPLSFLK